MILLVGKILGELKLAASSGQPLLGPDPLQMSQPGLQAWGVVQSPSSAPVSAPHGPAEEIAKVWRVHLATEVIKESHLAVSKANEANSQH